jgi:hypothetical protein
LRARAQRVEIIGLGGVKRTDRREAALGLMFEFRKRDDLGGVLVSAVATPGSRASLGQCHHPLGRKPGAQDMRAPRPRALSRNLLISSR